MLFMTVTYSQKFHYMVEKSPLRGFIISIDNHHLFWMILKTEFQVPSSSDPVSRSKQNESFPNNVIKCTYHHFLVLPCLRPNYKHDVETILYHNLTPNTLLTDIFTVRSISHTCFSSSLPPPTHTHYSQLRIPLSLSGWSSNPLFPFNSDCQAARSIIKLQFVYSPSCSNAKQIRFKNLFSSEKFLSTSKDLSFA